MAPSSGGFYYPEHLATLGTCIYMYMMPLSWIVVGHTYNVPVHVREGIVVDLSIQAAL